MSEVERRLFKQIGYNEPDNKARIDFHWVHVSFGAPCGRPRRRLRFCTAANASRTVAAPGAKERS